MIHYVKNILQHKFLINIVDEGNSIRYRDRQNFTKIDFVLREIDRRKSVLKSVLVHTGMDHNHKRSGFPCHPVTRKNMSLFNIDFNAVCLDNRTDKIKNGLIILDPLGYNEFLSPWKDSAAVLTDSGGLQEETTALKVPCITMRENTERPITAEIGSNVFVGTNPEKIINYVNDALHGKWKESQIPDLWDGKASERIAEILNKS